MPEHNTDPISPSLSEAFADAVLAFEAWEVGGTERKVTVGSSNYISIEAVCDFVDKFTDEMPPHVFSKLRSFLHEQPHGALIATLEADHSYSAGARCLRDLVKRKKVGH